MLIAGGIGITPIKAMAHTLKDRINDFHIHYAGRSGVEMAFRDELIREFGSDVSLYQKNQETRLDIKMLMVNAPDNALFYVCGPGSLIDAVISTAEELNIDIKRVRFERFVATIGADAKPIKLELSRSGIQIEVTSDQSILDAMIEAGVDSSFGCKAGNCKSCAVKVLSGKPEHRDSALSSAEKKDYGLMCPCVSRARSDHLTLDI